MQLPAPVRLLACCLMIGGCTRQTAQIDRTARQPADRTQNLAELVPAPPQMTAQAGAVPAAAAQDRLSQQAPVSTQQTTGPRLHTVQPGETLYGLARRYYNDPRQWRRIWQANSRRVKDPRRLPVGIKLIIP